MIKKIKIFIKDIYRNLSKSLTTNLIRRFLFAFFCFLLFFMYESKIETFIEKFILVNPNFSNVFLDFFILLTSIIVSILILIKILRDKYIPSYFEIFISISVLFLILYYGTIDIWNVLKLNLFYLQIEYLILIEIPILLFLLSTFYNWHKKKYDKPSPKKNINQFISDDPLLEIDEDKLDSKKVADNLINILKNENHENSFTLGLVGPWGNGKSSVINFVKYSLSENEENDCIIIHFLPYLNHNENDIINEFFILLSNELGKYSGKVSNQLMLYSKKLTSLYKDKNIFDFLENQITKIENTSANEIYTEINTNLKEINKKIIVFVDDLDRLNEKEILQVLKLIRNTANFKNTFFVVAMDKEYVLSRLKSNNDILNSTFIDKFFQLEIYLPEIDNSILRNYFFECLNNSTLSTPDGSFKIQLTEAMSNSDNLFDDFVKNIRDAKRVINQIVYDYPIFKNDIDLKDFINFTYFKLKFPKYLKLLNDRKANFIYIDRERETYNLIKRVTDKNSDNVLDELNKVKLYNVDFLWKYEISDLTKTNECLNSDLSINCDDRTLLLKTLAYLFGEENKVPHTSSIKNENNFRMLVQQQIFSNYFTQSEFEHLYDNDKLDPILLATIFANEKLTQLLKRLKDLNTNDEKKIKRSIEILIHLFEKRIDYELYEAELLNLLSTFVDIQFSYYKDKKVQPSIFSKWLIENIFDNEILLKETRLYLLGHIWYLRKDDNTWNISLSFITNKTKKLFNDYLNEYKLRGLDVNNFEIYFIYNSIKNITNIISNLNSAIINYWKENLELTCVQSIDFEPFSNYAFKISDTVSEIIGSKEKFIEFIESHPNSNLVEIKEFLSLFKLLSIKSHKSYTIFEFTNSKLMLKRIDYVKEIPSRSERDVYENTREVFFESNSEEFIDFLIVNQHTNKRILLTKFIYLGKFYLVVKLDKKDQAKSIINFVNSVVKNNIFKDKYQITKTLSPNNLNEIFFEINGLYYFKSYSIQPKLIK